MPPAGGIVIPQVVRWGITNFLIPGFIIPQLFSNYSPQPPQCLHNNDYQT